MVTSATKPTQTAATVVENENSVTTHEPESTSNEQSTVDPGKPNGSSSDSTDTNQKKDPKRVYEFKRLPLDQIEPDPNHARLIEDSNMKTAIQSGIEEYADLPDEHAILVRSLDGKYQIVDGHLRFNVAKEKALDEIPAHVFEMDEKEHFQAQVTCNTQNPLSNLEIGIRLIRFVEKNPGGAGKKGGQKEFAPIFGKSESSLSHARGAAEVYLHVLGSSDGKKTIESNKEFFVRCMEHLYHIKKAHKKFWNCLVALLLEKSWTSFEMKQIVKELQNMKLDPDKDRDKNQIASLIQEAITSIKLKPSESWKKRFVTQLSNYTPNENPNRIRFKDSVQKIIPFALEIEEEDDDFQETLKDHVQECQAILDA